MTDTNKLEKWAFPFKTAGASSAEVTDPQLYYDALAKAKNGFYPMGANGLWHGGVHFDAGTGAILDQSAVRCIADGEVIAYRIDERYPTSQYGEGPTAVHLPFSTGFVLVKHRLELPALPAAATPTATPSTPASAAPASEALTLYSLYMHLLDSAGYQAPGATVPPDFVAPARHTVSTRPTDPQLGLRVRKEASGGSTQVLALLPKGCKVTLGIADPLKPDWKPLLSIDEGAAIPPLASGVSGWVYSPELTGNTVADLAIDDEPALTLSHQGLRVRKEGKGTGTIIGVLPRGAQLKVGTKEANGYCKVLEVLDYHGVPALPNGADGKPQGYVYHADLDTSLTPPPFNTVTLLATPAPIKAGELIGHLGQYQNHDDAPPNALLHLEVFSCDDVPAFIAKSRALAASLPPEQKTLLHIQPGTKLVTHTASMCAATPPTVSEPGSTIGVSRIIPLAVLNSLPAERKIQTSTPMAGGAPIVTNWWRLDNAFADADGNLISGWLADVISTRHSPWEWQGFDFISETTSASEQLANHLAGQCLLSEAELPDYQAHISTADNGPIKTRLYDIIDGADGSTRDDKLSTTEIRAALGKPWHAQSISQLISEYESEWYWQDGKWDELDKLMQHTPETPNTDWVAEKARIKTLSWWDKVAGQHGIKADGIAWHFQMVGLMTNFINKGGKIKITVAMLKKVFEGLTNTNEADELLSEISNQINENCERYKLDSTLRLSHFFAQVRQEIGSKCRVIEDLTYNPEGLKGTFRYFRLHPSEATIYGYAGSSKFVSAENQIAIGNRAYASRYENGDISSEDGWRYRGRGLKHLTFKSNYAAFKEYHKNFWAEDVDFVQSPDLLHENYKYSVRSGVYFWLSNNLFIEADKGATDSTVDSITRIINEATDSYGKRRDNFKRIFENEKIFENI